MWSLKRNIGGIAVMNSGENLYIDASALGVRRGNVIFRLSKIQLLVLLLKLVLF